MNRSGLVSLTQREIECLRLVARLFTDKQIARELNIEPSTVKTLIGRAMRKLEVNSRATAARALAEHETCPPQWGTSQHEGQPSRAAQARSLPAAPEDGAVAGALPEARSVSDVGPNRGDVAPLDRGRIVGASRLQRAALIVATAFLLVVVAIASVPLADAVQRVVGRIAPGRSTR